VLAHSSREGSSAQPRQPQEPPARSKSVALGTMGKRQRYQRHGLLGSAWNNMPRINPAGPLKRIWRRETPGPPVSWFWVQAHPPRAKRRLRKDAGNPQGAGTRSRSSGKQKSVGTHRGRASRHVARQSAEGRPSPGQVVESADADNGGSSLKRMSCDGRSGSRTRKRSVVSAYDVG